MKSLPGIRLAVSVWFIRGYSIHPLSLFVGEGLLSASGVASSATAPLHGNIQHISFSGREIILKKLEYPKNVERIFLEVDI
jgi:hypothetical protein